MYCALFCCWGWFGWAGIDLLAPLYTTTWLLVVLDPVAVVAVDPVGGDGHPTPGNCTSYKGIPESWQFFFHELSGVNDFSLALKA